MSDRVILEYRGVRIDLTHVQPRARAAAVAEAEAWIAAGQRPPILTVRAGGVDVSERPDLWPALYRDYRGLGRLEWVGSQTRTGSSLRASCSR